MIEADLRERFGVDLEDRDLLRRRSWRWLRIRIEQLLTVPPVLVFGPDRVVSVPQTRIGGALGGAD